MNANFQRILLYAALGLTVVMIWSSWDEFQAQRTGQYGEQNGADSAFVQPDRVSNLSEDVPDAPAVTASNIQDNAQAGGDTPQPFGEDAFSSSKLISVTTDLLHIEIDTHGGDLVTAELLAQPVSVDTPDIPFVLMHRNAPALFIAQGGIIGNDREFANHNVDFTAERFNYDLGDRDSIEVKMRWTAPDEVVYTKVFRFQRNSYKIDIDYEITNNSPTQWRGFAYGQLKQTEIAVAGSMGFLGRLPSYNGAAIYTETDNYEKIDYDDMREGALNKSTPFGWVAMLQHYFVAAWLPSGSDNYQLYSGVNFNTPLAQYRIGYKSTQPVDIAPGASGVVQTDLYVGTKEQDRLAAQNVEGLTLTVDYGWLTPIADPLFWLLNEIHGFTNNWGWSIIFLTFLVKLVFYPLSAASYKSMAKMKKLSPRMATLKERYADDKPKFQKEMMKMYKEAKVNPAGGCLPILVQIPVFIALYWVLLESVELRQASWLGWLNDLSLPDPYFVLPIVMGASMFAQHFLNPAPVDPIQKKIMMALPLVFTIFFLWFPAGLVLYWVVNNLLSISQQYYITRKLADS